MSYQVLARKYRPRTFDELVGQEHVSRALMHALDQDRLHHAYLFTGTRGVGKTTIARILSRCLNCEKGVSARPCGVCPTCVEIGEGRFVDLIEVDAASRTKVEDTRELLDNVQYAPTRGRYKVYLIDEVHMLSAHSFNALLKTLEEPPPHVKFLLATTDPQKLPVTVLSRCLQFSLKALPAEHIAQHLQTLLEREMIRYDYPALQALGKAAQGSMRDALSLTDQAIAFGGEQLSTESVHSMLGTVDRNHVLNLLIALAEADPAGLLAALDQVCEQSPDVLGLLDELISQLHAIAVAQVVPDSASQEHGKLAAAFTAEQIQLYYDVALRGRRDLQDAPDSRAALEMILLRMVLFSPKGVLPAAPATGDASVKKPDGQGAPVEAGARPDLRALLDSPAAAKPAAPAPQPAAAPPTVAAPAPASPATAPDNDPPPWAVDGAGQAPAASAPASVDEQTPAPSAAAPSSESPQAGTATSSAPFAAPSSAAQAEAAEPQPAPQVVEQAPPEPLSPLAEPAADEDISSWWAALLDRLPLDGTVRNLARNTELVSRDQGNWTVRISTGHEVLVNRERLDTIAEALTDYYQRRIQLQVEYEQQLGETPEVLAEQERLRRLAEATATLHNDPTIQQLVTTFQGRLDEESIRPRGD